LGMILGTIGLAVVVLRNALERRAELALMRAVGFRRGSIQWMVVSEHLLLLFLGLLGGTVSGFVSVFPAVSSSGKQVPFLSLFTLLAAMAVSGVFWTWLAARLALRGPLLDALRKE